MELTADLPQTRDDHRVVVAELGDELDLVSAALIETALDQALEQFLDQPPGARDAPFVIDLTGVRLLSSPAVRVLESFAHRARACHVRPRVRVWEGTAPHRVLAILGLVDDLHCEVRPRPDVARRDRAAELLGAECPRGVEL